MYQNDYLMRQIWGLTQWIRKQTQQHPDDEARRKDANRAEIGEWYRRFRLPTLGVWLRLSESAGVRLLSNEGSEPDLERLFAAAQILIEEGRLANQAGNSVTSFECMKRGFYAGLIAWRIGSLDKLESYGIRAWVEQVLLRIQEIPGFQLEWLSQETRRELALYYEQIDAFDLSENTIFTLVHEKSTSLDKFVEQWVGRLRDRSQTELMRGGMSRNEVEESWQQWQALRQKNGPYETRP
jgi:hypothetical protein